MSTRSALEGKRVLITRPEDQAEEFAEKLRALGAEPVVLPAIELRPPGNWAPIDRALQKLQRGGYDWVAFTSANGVRFALERLHQLRVNVQALKGAKLAAIGPATAQALRRAGLRIAFVPSSYVAEAIAEGLGDVRGKRVLLLRADVARRDLRERLAQKGARVEEVAVYRTRPARREPDLVQRTLRSVDVVTFTSGSTVHALLDALGDAQAALDGVIVACIGPITARAARGRGLPVHVEAKEHTTDGLLRALVEFLVKGDEKTATTKEVSAP